MKKNNIIVENHSDTRVVLKDIVRAVEFYSKMERIDILSLNISFVGRDQMKEMNYKYLNHAGGTDIITFDYSADTESSGEKIDAEIIISPNQAKINAKKYNVTIKNELHRLVFHGLLHLSGYDDQSTKDKKMMRSKEDEMMNLWDQYNF
ncbi:MAG: rRNA maturation RNase YbeY [Candidatus Delongbacteria bacterium]